MDVLQGDNKFWLTILLRGDKSSVDRPVDEYVEEFRRAGLSAVTVPILEFKYKNLDELKSLFQDLQSKEGGPLRFGLIITSPRVVEALSLALQDSGTALTSCLGEEFVFVVGHRTAENLERKLGLKCNKGSVGTGSGRALFSYIREYCDSITTDLQLNLVYPKGNLADDALESALKDTSIALKPVIVYETLVSRSLESDIIGTVSDLNIPPEKDQVVVNYAFFSPSGVEAFRKIDSQVNRDRFRQILSGKTVHFLHSAIGKTTETALIQNEYEVFGVASMPNATSLLASIKDKMVSTN